MKLRNRFLLVLFGLLVFIAITPILVLFTTGYQIDWDERKIVKTGVLIAKTLPAKALVFLDNKQIEGETPETIRFLLPGVYDVRIEKDGFQSWTKRLAINAQFATWANFERDFITLFFKQPEKISSTGINFSSVSQNGEEIAYIKNNRLNIYNVANQSHQELGNISDLDVPFTFTDFLHWSNGRKVLNFFTSHSNNFLFDVKNIRRVEANGDAMALLVGSDLYKVTGNTPVLIEKGVSGFRIDGENIWFVQGAKLAQYNLRTDTTSVITLGLPQSATSQIVRGDGNTFLILDNTLYTLNDELEKIYDGVNFADYDTSADLLLFSGDNEILLYNSQTKNTQLILRSISKVSSPILNTYSGYLFFMNENKIKAIELDGRDHRNIYNIADVPAEADFALTSDATILSVFNDSILESYRIR